MPFGIWSPRDHTARQTLTLAGKNAGDWRQGKPGGKTLPGMTPWSHCLALAGLRLPPIRKAQSAERNGASPLRVREK